MSILPNGLPELFNFCEAHAPVWETEFASIGITSTQATQFKNLTGVARAAYNTAQSARDASKAATITQNANVRDMRNAAADLIRTIKAFAENQTKPETVYAAAQIPEPLPPAPLPAPGVPQDVVVTLEPSGAVTISWAAFNAAASSGAFYNVSRKLPGQSTFVPIGGAPGTTSQSRRMSFTDTTIPTSAAGSGAQYIITGQRGVTMGPPSNAITVQFGVEGTAGGFAVSGATGVLKMAA
jgi:hypothetical protein